LAKNTLSAVLGLLTGALVWGLIWYPYRILEDAGVSGVTATLITYAIALGLALVVFRRHVVALLRPDAILVLIGLAAGWTNVAYVLGMLHGEVMQVLLLFYLAPLWTLLFARVLLGERPGMTGFLIILLSLAGAGTMLWQPGLRIPLPHTGAEWFGLSAGFTFAVSNVLIRKASHHPIAVKSMAAFAGVGAIALALLPFAAAPLPAWPELAGGSALWLLPTLGLVLLSTNLAVQHGLDHLSANQAIVILLSELIVAALSAYLLAGESMRWNEWAGGAMIVGATLLSGRLSAGKHA
jgi:drug/metabolite transporter (DMT)-like permease